MREYKPESYMTVRLTVDATYESEIIQWLNNYEEYCVGFETRPRPYYHIVMSYVDKGEIKNALDEMGIPKGNKGRQIAPIKKTVLAALAYTMKDSKYKIKGFEGIVDLAKLEIEKHVPKDKVSILEDLRRIIKSQIKSHILDNGIESFVMTGRNGDEFLRKEWVLDQVLSYYKEKRVLIREFYIVSLCQTLCFEFIPQYENEFRDRILEKI